MRGTAGGAIEVVALRAIAAGEEVSYCYGASLSNDDFLLDYGFVPSHNAHDECSLAWDPSGALLQSACDVAGVEGLELGGAPYLPISPYISPISPLYLPSSSAVRPCHGRRHTPLYLPYISPTSRLYLGYISATPPLTCAELEGGVRGDIGEI